MFTLHRRAAAITVRYVGAAGLLAGLAACGYKGPLYMPPPPPPPSATLTAPPDVVPESSVQTSPVQPAAQPAPAPSGYTQ
ncbi:hypothetical protein GSY71_05995 [Pusillimonas sp. TS35]|uniref:LPS translocon maturation chaperone LptM n=1 Tax=Paracandidimonas lactea TaxID=2895524 RepID=UPI001367F3C6|nr:lipoprotein [Paracandidimonas lactea]MYN12698.1 hypothetical protein [Pusillimonas sp. TS35]